MGPRPSHRHRTPPLSPPWDPPLSPHGISQAVLAFLAHAQLLPTPYEHELGAVPHTSALILRAHPPSKGGGGTQEGEAARCGEAAGPKEAKRARCATSPARKRA
jgi:hypothetical protein